MVLLKTLSPNFEFFENIKKTKTKTKTTQKKLVNTNVIEGMLLLLFLFYFDIIFCLYSFTDSYTHCTF